MQENLSGAIVEEPPKVAKKEENKQEKKSPEMTEVKLEGETDEQVDMSGMINEILSRDRTSLSQALDYDLMVSIFINDSFYSFDDRENQNYHRRRSKSRFGWT